MLTIQAALAQTPLLEAVGDTPRLDIELLLMHVLGVDKAYLYTWPERELSVDQEQRFGRLLEQRRSGVPVAYLVGCREFWSLPLAVNEGTLIPRPETELLVQLALQLFTPEPERVVADLGTGAGAIALAIAVERPSWRLIASDRIALAVALAEQNRQRLALQNVTCILSDWCKNLPHLEYDLMISNPPYIDPQDPHLTLGDVRFEPRSALIADEQGLGDIKRIAAQAKELLRQGGYLLLEHGWNQAGQVRKILAHEGYTEIDSYRDLAGCERATQGRWPGIK